MREKIIEYLKVYLQGVFKCETTIETKVTFEDVDRNKFAIAKMVYQEILLMRVRSLCNVKLEYFSN